MDFIARKVIKKPDSQKRIHCSIHSEDGMRKEATVEDITGEKWRIICDEGPYLNGADSAPPPLAYFSAGMAFGFVSQLNLIAEETQIHIEDYEIIQDNYYTIEGSAVRGTMISGGLPVDVQINITSSAPKQVIAELIEQAKNQNPVYQYIESQLENAFQLYHNKTLISESERFFRDQMQSTEFSDYNAWGHDLNSSEFIVSKQEQVETLFDVEGGKGTALKESQKRKLHIRAITRPYKDGLAKTQVQIFKPLGSTFQFICDLPKRIGGQLRTPSSLAYASAGIGFCFMTQIGRYAKIKKYGLDGYSVDQLTNFAISESHSKVFPIQTATHINSKYDDHIAAEILKMSEQTCFLHGAMKEKHQVNFTINITSS